MADLVLREAGGWLEVELPREIFNEVWDSMVNADPKTAADIVEGFMSDFGMAPPAPVREVRAFLVPDSMSGERGLVWIRTKKSKEWLPKARRR